VQNKAKTGQKWLNNAKMTANYLVCNIEGGNNARFFKNIK
jgi:hypothetical protein